MRKHIMNRQFIAVVLLSTLFSARFAWGQGDLTEISAAAKPTSSSPYDAVGRLHRNLDVVKGQPTAKVAPYVLVDSTGKPGCYLTPDKGVDLRDFMDQRVGVNGTVRRVEGDPLPHLIARNVKAVGEPAGANRHAAGQHRDGSHVRAVANHEELPVPQPDPSFSGQPEEITPGHTQRHMDQGTVNYDEGDGGNGYGIGNVDSAFDDCNGGNCQGGVCSMGNCNACVACCNANDPGMWWVRGEYLAWSTSGMDLPPLVTTGPDEDNPGILGMPGTEILFGNETVNKDVRSGARISFGRWLDADQKWGIGGEYFGLEDASTNFFASSDADGSPIISRPFFSIYNYTLNEDDEVVLGVPRERIQIVSLPDDTAGSVRVDTNTSFQGAGAWLRYNICCKNTCWKDCWDCCDPCNSCGSGGVPGGVRVGLLGGYRFMRLRDSVNITEDLTSLRDAPFDGNFIVNDQFSSSNSFNGAEVGFVVEARKARWTLELLSKLAIGNNRQTVDINGYTDISNNSSQPSINGTYSGGLLTQDTNIGSYSRDQLSLIPQLNANLGYNITPRMKVLVGYTFIYWSQVARAGNQISLDVNEAYIPPQDESPVPGPERPEFVWRDSNFWAQGINVGLDYRF